MTTPVITFACTGSQQVGQQGGLGFRAEVLIEDTHTSIDLFRQGWRSVYVNFPNVSELFFALASVLVTRFRQEASKTFGAALTWILLGRELMPIAADSMLTQPHKRRSHKR